MKAGNYNNNSEAVKLLIKNSIENTTLIDLICEDNICYGGILKNSSKTYSINSKFTILATGGIGGIFISTTNVEYLTGDGSNISLMNV